MPFSVSSSKLKDICKDFGYIGGIDDLSVGMLESYVRKYYELRDSWKFRGVKTSDVNGEVMKMYNFDHVGLRVMQDKVIER
jgi:hypothetical protein